MSFFARAFIFVEFMERKRQGRFGKDAIESHSEARKVMQAPQIAEPENTPIEARPLPDTLREVEKFFTAVNESRVHIDVTIDMGPPINVQNRIVVDPPA